MPVRFFSSKSFDMDQGVSQVYATHLVKTLQILFFQFLFTFGSVCLVAFNETVRTFVMNALLQMITIGGLGGLFTILYMQFIADRKTLTQLAIFTIFESIIVCTVPCMYGQEVVLMAMLGMIGIVCGLGMYAMTTSNDHTGLGGILLSGLTCLLMMSIFNMFLGSEIVRIFELYVGILVFFAYVVYDVQYFLSERCTKLALVREDLHIDAAINIYLDAISIFMRLLEIIDRNKKSSKND